MDNLGCGQVKVSVASLDERNDDVVANLRSRELKYVLSAGGQLDRNRRGRSGAGSRFLHGSLLHVCGGGEAARQCTACSGEDHGGNASNIHNISLSLQDNLVRTPPIVKPSLQRAPLICTRGQAAQCAIETLRGLRSATAPAGLLFH
jgi:hypothetical protein